MTDLFLQSLRFWKFAQRIYGELGYYGSLSVMHRIDCTEDVIFIPSFPSSSGSSGYTRTETIVFPGNESAHAKGSSSIVREAEGWELEDPLDMVCESNAWTSAPTVSGQHRLPSGKGTYYRATGSSWTCVYTLRVCMCSPDRTPRTQLVEIPTQVIRGIGAKGIASPTDSPAGAQKRLLGGFLLVDVLDNFRQKLRPLVGGS
jgi:hypothetical protein